jgi:hypothetical protein
MCHVAFITITNNSINQPRVPKSSQEMNHTLSDKEVHHRVDKSPPVAVSWTAWIQFSMLYDPIILDTSYSWNYCPI